MSNIMQPGSQYPPADYVDFLGFASNGEAYKRPRAYAVKLQNAELTEQGRIVSPRGYRSLGVWGDIYRIREILQFKNDVFDGLLIFGSDAGDTVAKIATVTDVFNSPNFTNVRTLTEASVESVLLQFGSLAYLFNGTDDQFYDGSSWGDIGAFAPSSPPTLSTTIAGDLNTGSDYKVGYCWYDSNNKRRTNISPLSLLLTTGGDSLSAGLRINLPAESAPTGYDKKQIYCTLGFGSQLFLDQTVSASATSIDITASDELRAENYIYEGDDDPPPQKFDIAIKANGKIYAGSTEDATCRVLRSKVSRQYGSMSQSFPPTHFTDCEPSASDKLRGFGKVGNKDNETVIVVKQKSFGRIDRLSSDVEVYHEIAQIGGHGHKSVFQVGDLCGFVSESNIILTDGYSYQDIAGGEDGQAIRQTLKNLSQSYKQKVNVVVVESDKQIRVSAVLDGRSYPQIVLLGHYQMAGDGRVFVKWTTREPGPNLTTWPGVQAACMKVVLDADDKKRVIFGNSNANGKLYEWDYGYNDDGAAIYKNWEFRPETFGDLKNDKIFSDIHCRIRTGNQETEVTFGVKKNLKNSIKVLAQKTISASGFVMGDSQLGVTTFSSAPVAHLTIPCHIRAQEIGFVVREGTTKTIELLDFTMTGMP